MKNNLFHRKEYVFLGGIIMLGLFTIAAMSVINHTWQDTDFTDYADDAETYNRTAELLLDRGSFHDEQSLYVGMQRRSPGYPIFLAFAYGLFGKTPISVFFAHGLLFIGSLILLWLLARLYFSFPSSLFPSLLLSLSWFIALGVTKISTELFSLFLLLLFVYLFQTFFLSPRPWRALGAGAAFSWFLLIKPAALYLAPFIILLIILRARRTPFVFSLSKTFLLFFIIPIFIVGAWTVRGIIVFQTWQIQSGSFVLGYRGIEATRPWDRIAAAFIGGLAGDIIADKIFPGYARNPEPYPSIDEMTDRFVWLGTQGLSEADREHIVYTEASRNMRANPLKFLVLGITGLFRQNTPMNHKGIPVTHAFTAEGLNALSDAQKIGVLLAIRIMWYVFLAAVLYGAYTRARQWQTWGIILIFVFGYNLLYAFFTHNEARYMIPLFPFYFLLFTAALFSWHNTKVFAKKILPGLPSS